MTRRGLMIIFPLLTLMACGDPIGSQCELTSGALGFGFADDCKTKCLQLEDVQCPDGSTVRKALCAGAVGCEPGSCDEGQACYSFEDPFEKYFYCLPDDFCGGNLSDADIAAWELASRQRSDAIRARFAERAQRRLTAKPTGPAQPVQDAPAVVQTPVPVAPAITASPGASVLIESWGFDMAPVVCVSGDSVTTGANCASYLPVGMEVEHGGWRVRSTGPKTLECAAMHPVKGVGAERIGTAAGSAERWAWVPSAPAGFEPATLAPLDPMLLAVARTVIPDTSPDMRIELAAVADFDGNGAMERVLRTFSRAHDSDKLGHTTLWIVDEASIRPLPTGGMEINGVQDVRGVLHLNSGGALLVFTSEWMGGSGLHVVGPGADGRLGPIGEVACGS